MSEKLTRAESARINGAKSRGPTSPEGKARSSQNAVKHGLTAQQFLFMPEHQAEFNAHLAAVISYWNPQCDYELYLATKLARAEYLHDRAESIQTNLIDLETIVVGDEIQRAFEHVDMAGAIALGYKSLDEHSTAHRNLDRHIARLSRERVQAVKNLQTAIAGRQAREREQADAEVHAESDAAAELPRHVAPAEPPAPAQNEPNMPAPQSPVTPNNNRQPLPWTQPVPQSQPAHHPLQNEPNNADRNDEDRETPLAPAA